MIEEDSNGELRTTIPPMFNGGVFFVLVQNNETNEVYTTKLRAFTSESDALDYAGTFTQHWISARVLLLPIVR